MLTPHHHTVAGSCRRRGGRAAGRGRGRGGGGGEGHTPGRGQTHSHSIVALLLHSWYSLVTLFVTMQLHCCYTPCTQVGRDTILQESGTVQGFSVRAFGQNCRMNPSMDPSKGGMRATVPVPCKTNLGKHWWKVTPLEHSCNTPGTTM